MIKKINLESCLYQDDVVDLMVKNNLEDFLKENTEGNLVLGNKILNNFKKETKDNVVWVIQGKYWRNRVLEDDKKTRFAKG